MTRPELMLCCLVVLSLINTGLNIHDRMRSSGSMNPNAKVGPPDYSD